MSIIGKPLMGGGGASYEMFPVGSIYTSTSSENPATYYGGTWEQIQDVFLLGAGSSYSAGTTGGADTVTLGINHLPAHTHYWMDRHGTAGSGYNDCAALASSSGTVVPGSMYTTGGGGAHNNMPPYKAVYIWKRTA